MIVKLSKILNVEMCPDLLGPVVVLLSQRFVFQVVVETVDGRQSSLVEFGSVGHVGFMDIHLSQKPSRDLPSIWWFRRNFLFRF